MKEDAGGTADRSREVVMYRDSDGNLHENERDAIKADERKRNLERIEKFLDKCYPVTEGTTKQGPARGSARNAVMQFLEGGF